MVNGVTQMVVLDIKTFYQKYYFIIFFSEILEGFDVRFLQFLA